MARPKGSKNKHSSTQPMLMALPMEERITAIANLIVDRIIEDQSNGYVLLNRINGNGYV